MKKRVTVEEMAAHGASIAVSAVADFNAGKTSDEACSTTLVVATLHTIAAQLCLRLESIERLLGGTVYEGEQPPKAN